MMGSPSEHYVLSFRTIIAERTGLWFEDGRLEFLAKLLTKRLTVLGMDAASYLFALAREQLGAAEIRALAPELTVGETYFFRHCEQMAAFAQLTLPARAQVQSAAGRVRILSAGCASGEEPYSLSILARESNLPAGLRVEITALDLNPDAIERATTAAYGRWAMRETSDALKKRYFKAEGQSFRLRRELLYPVTFHQENLAATHPWKYGSFDIIFCRNVLMYLSAEQSERILRRLTSAVLPGGFLFLGHAESLRGRMDGFRLCDSHSSFYYRRTTECGIDPSPSTPGRGLLALTNVRTWAHDVQRSSERIVSLSDGRTDARDRPVASLPTDAPDRSRQDLLDNAWDLVSKERFAEALSLADSLLDDPDEPEVLLLRAALLTHCDQTSAAEQACRRLLHCEGHKAGAHYVLALCAERRGQLTLSMEHDQTASELDETFAMPRLHLGLTARRLGDRDRARAALGAAAIALPYESGRRVMLFGGGFRREALMNLCLLELQRLDLSSVDKTHV